jgi:hypothetical protein
MNLLDVRAGLNQFPQTMAFARIERRPIQEPFWACRCNHKNCGPQFSWCWLGPGKSAVVILSQEW